MSKTKSKENVVVFILISSCGELAGTERVLLDWCNFIDIEKSKIIICSNRGKFWAIFKEKVPFVHFVDFPFDINNGRVARFTTAMKFFRELKANKIVWLYNGMKAVSLWEMTASWIITKGNTYISHHVYPNKVKNAKTGIPQNLFTGSVFSRMKINFDIYLQHLLAKRILVVSNDIREYLTKNWKLPARKVVSSYTGVDLSLFNTDKKKYNLREIYQISGNSLIFIAINRFAKQKRIDRLLGSFLLLLKGKVDAFLFIAGEGDLKDYYERKIYKNKLLQNRVKLLGFRKDIAEIVPSADFLLLASDTEGQSNVIKEAIACSLIPIVTDVSGSCEISRGVFVAKRNVFDFYRKIKEVILLDKSEIEKIKQQNLDEIKEKFDLRKCCINNISVFDLTANNSFN